MEEYMESELSGIFRVKLVTKNIVRGSPGTQFMHMRVNLFLKIWDFELGDSYKLISYRRKSVYKVHIRDGCKLYYAVTERNRFIFNQTFELN